MINPEGSSYIPEEAMQPEQETTEGHMRKRLLEAKEVMERMEINDRVRNIMHQMEVMGVITGIKPASALSLETQRAMEIAGTPNPEYGVSENDIGSLSLTLDQLGLDIFRTSFDVESASPSTYEIFEVMDQARVVQTMEKNPAFSDFDVRSFKNNPRDFFINTFSRGAESDNRVGFLYGYPNNDVEDFIKMQNIEDEYGIDTWDMTYMQESIRQDLAMNDGYEYTGAPKDIQPKDTYRDKYQIDDDDWQYLNSKPIGQIHIDGVANSMDWTTYNPESPEVQEKIKSFKEMVRTQKEVFDFGQ